MSATHPSGKSAPRGPRTRGSALLASLGALRRNARYVDLLLVVICAIVLAEGLAATRGWEWPPSGDLHRDIAQAQNIRDGHLFIDQFYRGERAWYNPLVPAIVAGLSLLTHLPVHTLYTRAGAYLNLLGPVTFYLMLVFLFDRWTALAATVALLFVVGGNLRDYASAGYSPTLYTLVFSQGLFYLTILVYDRVAHREQAGASATRRLGPFAVGILLALAFLANGATAILLAATIGADTAHRLMVGSHRRQVLLSRLAMAATALLGSTPLLYTIVWHYRLKILNPAPNDWVYQYLALSNTHSFIMNYLSLHGVLCLVGLVQLLRMLRSQRRTLLLAWPLTTIAFIGYDWLRQLLQAEGRSLPGIVPSVGFLFYLKAFEAILIGCGILWICRLLLNLAERLGLFLRLGVGPGASSTAGAEHVLFGVVILGVLLGSYPFFGDREWIFAYARETRANLSETSDEAATFAWIRAHAAPGDVFLADDRTGLFAVAPSGRKVVAIGPYFSNPYVDWSSRARDRATMLGSLLSGQSSGPLLHLAAKYQVTYVIGRAEQCDVLRSNQMLRAVFGTGGICILQFVN